MDPGEREAERVAENLAREPRPQDGAGRLPGNRAGGLPAPPVAREVLRSPGEPLPPATRALFEPRLGHDFGNVRIHTGARAAESARAVGASAYTVGRDVVFGEGRYSPDTPAGQRLIAHELAHVVQQAGGSSRPVLQRQKETTAPAKGTTFWFSVKIGGRLTSEQLLLEFVKQYYKLDTDEEAEEVRKKVGWDWTGTPRTPTQDDVEKGYILIAVTDNSLDPQQAKSRRESSEYYRSLPPEEKDRMSAEVDRRFWEKTNYKVGEKLGTSAEDKKMAEYWMALRDELLRQRKDVEALPAPIKDFIFTEDAPQSVEPKDYATVLRIAEKLTALSEAELADYKSKVIGETTDWSRFEASVDRYLAERARRRASLEEREKIKTRLFGMKTLYAKYKEYRALQGASSLPSRDEFGVRDPNVYEFRESFKKSEADLISGLKRAGFGSIADFERTIREYEAAFEKETVAIALDMLARYEHVLYEEEKKYRDPANVAALHASLGKTKAKQRYLESEAYRRQAAMIHPDPDTHDYMPGELTEKVELQSKASEARAEGEKEVRSLSGEHPLLQNQDFPHEELARADADSVRSVLVEYIEARKEDIRETRENLTEDPELVYKLDKLLKASYQAQGITPDSIYDQVIQDRVREVKVDETVRRLALAVFAIAIGLLTFGGGTVAVLAAGASLAISAYDVAETIREYEVMSGAAGAQLLSEEEIPSFAWVLVAVAGAGLDVAGLASALKAMKPAVQTFNAAGEAADLAKLEKSLEAISEIDARLRTNVMRAAEAELQYRKAVKNLLSTGGQLRMVIVPGAEELAKLLVVAYYAAKRGIIAFERFLLDAEIQKQIGAILKLSPEEMKTLSTAPESLPEEILTPLKQAFEEGVAKSKTGLLNYGELPKHIRALYKPQQVEDLAAHGKSLGLSDAQIQEFLQMGADAKLRKKPLWEPEQLKRQMESYGALPQQIRGGYGPRQAADVFAHGKALGLGDEQISATLEHGASLGMGEDGVRAFLKLQEKNPALTPDQVKAQMDAWAAAKQQASLAVETAGAQGFPFGFESAEQWARFKTTADELLTRLLKSKDPDARAFLQGSAVSGISYEKQIPFGPHSDLDVAIASEKLFAKAENAPRHLDFKVAESPRRIGPLSDEQIEHLKLEELWEGLSKIFADASGLPTREINFMLFNKPAAVMKPIGAASKETIRPALPLK